MVVVRIRIRIRVMALNLKWCLTMIRGVHSKRMCRDLNPVLVLGESGQSFYPHMQMGI